MNILVVSPHPDDETLGAGGSLQRLERNGHQTFWLNVTDISEQLGYKAEQVKAREKQIEKIKRFYKFTDFYNMKLDTTRLDQYEDRVIIKKISDYFNEIKPEWIFLPDYNDAHSDHKTVFDWVYACTKVFRNSSIKRIMTMEILSETNFGRPENPFSPNFYIDISDYMDQKIEAVQIYESEIEAHPFPRSIEVIKSLGILRGSEAGKFYAEAFRVIKIIE